MFAQTFEVIGTMRGYIVEILAFTFGVFTACLSRFVIEVVMIFKLVIAETFGFWTHHLALLIFAVAPTVIQSVFAFLGDRQS